MEGAGLNREPRYTIGSDHTVRVLARPFGMKYYNFELLAENVSLSGVHLYSHGKGFVPFRKEGRVVCTFDVHAAVFERPVHMLLDIVRIWEENKLQHFGASIISIESYQKVIFERDIKKLKTIDHVARDKGFLFKDAM